ncbi:MAG: hypothetical protein K8I27_12640 [Planctomycetes bacterium]|nr:hypothetical protein [Planctomycetota bacterium]
MNDERDRLEDLNIEEAVGRSTPPDLAERILAAAGKRELDDAVTPISGRHAVPRTHRPTGRRMTSPIARKNWQGAGVVTAFALLFVVGLIAFILLNDPSAPTEQDTAETQEKTDQDRNQPRQRFETPTKKREPSSPDSNEEQPTQPAPTDEPEPESEPDKPEDVVDQPEPRAPVEEPQPEPRDTVKEPEPEPEQPKEEPVKPEPEQPKGAVEQPKDDDKTEVKPEPKKVAVAYIPEDAWRKYEFGRYSVRRSASDEWNSIHGLEKEMGRIWLYEGWQLKTGTGELYFSNGALLQLDGEVEFHTHTRGLRIELIDDDLYVDNVASSSTVFVTHEGLEVEVGNGAAVIESSSGKLGIFCVDGQVSAGGKLIAAGHKASLSNRGLSSINEVTRRDWSHPLLTGARLRQLGIEDFDPAPLGGMISGKIETRTAEQLGLDDDGHVAVDNGGSASVAFRFDGDHETLRGEKVRVRYRVKGAKKLILQMFCPARNDNFGTDIVPGKEGEWNVLEIALSDLRNRETHKDAPPPGTVLSSFALALTGQDDAQIEVDWVELVREAEFEK